MLLYTSGTTGRPKGCLLSQSAWLASNANLVHGLRLEHGERLLAVYPLYHVAGFGMAMSVLTLGGAIVFCESASPGELWPLVARYDVTRTGLPGLRAQLDAATPAATGSLRGVVGGANMESARTLERTREVLPGAVFNGVYGSTEAGNFVTVTTAAEELERPGTIGRPLPGFDVRIAGENGGRAAPGNPGELCLRGASTMSGYWRTPEATDDALRDGWVHTGDVVRADDDGYLYLIDRVKDMIKSGGENVYSIEVETVLLHHPSVADVAVHGVSDPRWGEAVKAVVVPAPGAAPTPEELDAFCRERLAAYKRPRWYELVDQIARSQTGKIVKRELRAAHDPGRCTRLAESS
jgi:acyl-CoA synthetase (AMP-forming)/AMP-acid ligase II